MPHRYGSVAARTALLTIILTASAVSTAKAVVLGTSSSLGHYTVRLVGPYYCSGVAISQRYVVTASHCANRRMRVLGGGGSVGIASVSRSAVLEDGRRVSAAGDAAILRLTAPISVGPAPIGDGGGDTFTIAGYGTTDERARAAFGTLHEASLVAMPDRQLVDPNRSGTLSASACFGDSGGPVMRGGMLVGVITRANHPRKSIACGFYTRWAPITVHGTVHDEAAINLAEIKQSDSEAPRPAKSRRHARRTKEPEVQSLDLLTAWFGPKAETPKALRRRSASR